MKVISKQDGGYIVRDSGGVWAVRGDEWYRRRRHHVGGGDTQEAKRDG